MERPEITTREVETIEEMNECIRLQRAVFAMPDMEISPVRHLIVARCAGGFTMGAYLGERLVGFVLSLPMFLENSRDRAFYSHMTAVDKGLQSLGIGTKLKWAQRERALAEGANYIKWTYQPVLARNAFFNIERLGVTINTYVPNFYGTDAESSAEQRETAGVDSDRLFADWYLTSPKVAALSKGEKYEESGEVAKKIEIPPDWNELVVKDTKKAIKEQERIKHEFQTAFAEGLIVRGFERSETNPKYLLYRSEPLAVAGGFD
jgi:predicted GNAT superfamily acetyltransferase